MGYRALYRTFRSQRFDQIVGQKAIATTLKNAVKSGHLSHAYLFTGPRGTGKTSLARILAKAINCHHQEDGEPCNECETCRQITEGSLIDVIEVDAASNNGIDEIRQIKENINYPPTLADYKVYIIDEVHALSNNAFNALLKTLEEPPQNVVFILATTEVHRVLPTIVSRTQRFNFQKISFADIYQHLQMVLAEINLDYEPEALNVIARSAEGGMRDALSLLDQALNFANQGKLTAEGARLTTGSVADELLEDYFQAVVNEDQILALEKIAEIIASGHVASRFLEDLMFLNRDLLIFQEATQLLVGRNITDNFKNLAQKLSATKIYHYLDLLAKAQEELRFVNQEQIFLEVLTLKLINSSSSTVIDSTELMNRVVKLEQELVKLQQRLVDHDQHVATRPTSNELITKNNEADQLSPPMRNSCSASSSLTKIQQVLSAATKKQLTLIKEIWDELLTCFVAKDRALLKASNPVAASSTQVLIAYDSDFLAEQVDQNDKFKELVQQKIQQLIKQDLEMVIVKSVEWPRIRQDFLNYHRPQKTPKSQNSKSVATKSELEKKAIELFGEKMVKIVE